MGNLPLCWVIIAIFGTSIHFIEGSIGYGPGEQEYGYITIRNGANVFFWLFYAQTDDEYLNKPTVVWLNGGPGLSSTGVGNFGEIGPLFVNGTERMESWAKYVNVLFVDNPVGTGFSWVFNETFYQTQNIPNGADLTQFMISFFNFYPKMSRTPFYFYSEGFGGKNMVELSYQLNVAIREERIHMDFRGIALAGPWISPIDIVNGWGGYLMSKGIIDQQTNNMISGYNNQLQTAIANSDWENAWTIWVTLVARIQEATNYIDFLNINQRNQNDNVYATVLEDAEIEKLMNNDVRRALDVMPESVYDSQRKDVFMYLSEDFLFPVVNVISDLIRDSQLDIIILTGSLDLLSATPGTEKWIDDMMNAKGNNWTSIPKTPFLVNGIPKGQMKHLGNVTMYWIDNAGHMIPRDQPTVGLEILRILTHYDEY